MNKLSLRPTGMQRTHILLWTSALLLMGCENSTGQTRKEMPATKDTMSQYDHSKNPHYSMTDTKKLDVPLSEWKKILPADLYHVAFEKGTERPFTGKFEDRKGDGTYTCAVCGRALFDAHTKFDSGTGWPSFYDPKSEESVEDHVDRELGMVRTEVVCSRCGAHLGHVFDDGPRPTGLRYCINAVSLDLLETKP